MNEIWNTFQFFLPQILLGTIIGGLIACLGVIIVLRKMAFFGVTLSQVVSSSVAVSSQFENHMRAVDRKSVV